MAYSLTYTIAGLFTANLVQTAFTAIFGAKTLSGAGGYNPLDISGNPITLTSYNGVISGSIAGYTPSISNGSLIFTGAIGAPNGAVLSCTTNAGTNITIAIQTEANSYSVNTIAQANTAYQQCVLADKIRFRAGGYNLTATRQIISRTTSPAGTWTGTAILEDGNWVVMTSDVGATAKFGALEISAGGTDNPRYLKIDGLLFESPFQADTNGLGIGVSAGVGGQLFLNRGSHVWVNNCTFRHTSPVTNTSIGAFRALSNSTGFLGSVLITNNNILGGRSGLNGANYANSIVRGNTIRRILSDCFFVGACDNLKIIGNVITDKIYGATFQPVTNIVTGTTTTLTVPDTTKAILTEGCALTGFTGVYEVLNGKYQAFVSKTATTVTITLNTSGLPSGDVTGQVIFADALHGDYIQFAENLGLDVGQNNVEVRGNVLTRGETDGSLLQDGQGIYGGFTGNTAPRNNWLIEGNIYVGTYVRGISVGNLTNSIVRSNTVVRTLGIDASNGGSLPGILVVGTSTGNTFAHNIGNQFSLGSNTSINNYTLPLVANDASPANSTDIANYFSVFQAPVVVPNTAYNAIKSFATRTDAGGAFAGFAVFPGATPYYDYTTNVYSNPTP